MLKFTKMHGLGNDFVVIDAIDQIINLQQQQISFLADRKYGIGCDQVLIIEQSLDPSADFNYRIFNADGSEVEHCGNGARCVVEYLYAYKQIAKPAIKLKIKNRILTGTKSKNGIDINMGQPQFTPDAIPFIHAQNQDNIYPLKINDELITCGVVSMGNPHVCIKLEHSSALDKLPHLKHIALLLQNSPYFPQSVNVNFFVKVDADNIRLVTYERGCGFTLACGTGACATVCYAISQSLLKDSAWVNVPGGKLHIAWDKTSNDVILSGSAVSVFQGQLCNLIP